MIILNEKSRNDLVSNSKHGERERDGKTRYEKRVKSRLGVSTREYNQINMDQLFKDDIITINIKVNGETDDYIVKISYNGVLETLREEIKRNNDILDLRNIVKALIIAFNKNDVFIKCGCEDFKYRFQYWATVDKYNSGEPELRPTDETNPNNKLGAACKHILLVLSNTSWLIKVASVINNYIKYMERFRKTPYDSIIYPALYGKKKPIQTSLLDSEDEVEENSSEINYQGSKLGRGRKLNTPNNVGASIKPEHNQQSFFNDDLPDEE